MLETLQNLDQQIFLALHNLLRHAFMDDVMWMVSGRWVWVPLYCAIFYTLWRWRGWQVALVYTVGIALAVTCADQLCATFIRPGVARLRPANEANPLSAMVTVVNGYRGGRFGFPSCHAANTCALAAFMLLALHRPAVTWTLMAWALLNCLSRIYLGVHYPGDLIVGAAIGAFFGAFWWWLSQKATVIFRMLPVPVPSPRDGMAIVWTAGITMAVILVLACF